MRKVMLVLALFLAPLIAQAHDTSAHQTPIIALVENKLFAVSPLDGSATVLVEPPTGETFFMRDFGRLSPDGTRMVYATNTDPESIGGLVVTVFLLDLTTGSSTIFEPNGGVFDVKPHPPNTLRIDHPTWSVDGERLYYLLSEVDGRNYSKMARVHLAYYNVQTHTHKLVARLDPTEYVQNLMAVESGIIVNVFHGLGQVASLTLYAPDNRLLSEAEISEIYPHTVRDGSDDFYAVGAPDGGIDQLWRVDEPTTVLRYSEAAYYPAARSRTAGEKSLYIFRVIDASGTFYRVYSPDESAIKAQIEALGGVQYAIAPDGHSIAVLQSPVGLRAQLKIMDATGSMRELPFIAESIWWGAEEWVALYAGD